MTRRFQFSLKDVTALMLAVAFISAVIADRAIGRSVLFLGVCFCAWLLWEREVRKE
jgi:hypothetical protein